MYMIPGRNIESVEEKKRGGKRDSTRRLKGGGGISVRIRRNRTMLWRMKVREMKKMAPGEVGTSVPSTKSFLTELWTDTAL